MTDAVMLPADQEKISVRERMPGIRFFSNVTAARTGWIGFDVGGVNPA